MKLIFGISAIFFGFSSPSVFAEAQYRMAQLEFMTGCWIAEGSDHKNFYEERFTKPTENLMLGTSQLVRAGITEFYELLPVVKRDDKIIYVPYINGERSVDFTLTRVERQSVTFENLEHDYPQRIIYTRVLDVLTARIEGTQNGQTTGEDFVLKRANCE